MQEKIEDRSTLTAFVIVKIGWGRLTPHADRKHYAVLFPGTAETLYLFCILFPGTAETPTEQFRSDVGTNSIKIHHFSQFRSCAGTISIKHTVIVCFVPP